MRQKPYPAIATTKKRKYSQLYLNIYVTVC